MKKWGRRFVFSIQFLTRYPIPVQLYLQSDDFPRASAFFPFVGALVGLFSAVCAYVGWWTGSDMVAAVTAALGYVLITGAFHVDGLADTFDGMTWRSVPQARLARMKDPHIGARGAVALIVDMLVHVVLIYVLYQRYEHMDIYRMLLAAPVASRLGIVTACVTFRSARMDGIGAPFIDAMNGWDLFRTLIVAGLCLYGLIGWQMGAVLIGLEVLFSILLGKLLSGWIQGITGDTLGCINELGQWIAFSLFGLIWPMIH